MAWVLLHVIGDSRWASTKVFQKLWVRVLEVYDDIEGIRWMDFAIA